MYRDKGDGQPEYQIDGDSGLVHGAATTSEEDVLDDGHGRGGKVHAQSRTDKHGPPNSRVGVFDLLEAVLGPGMGEIDEEDKAEDEEKHCADEGDVVTPYLKECVGNQERQDDKGDPGNDLGPPETILKGGSRILGGGDTEEETGKDEVKETEGEIDSVDG